MVGFVLMKVTQYCFRMDHALTQFQRGGFREAGRGIQTACQPEKNIWRGTKRPQEVLKLCKLKRYVENTAQWIAERRVLPAPFKWN